VLPQDMQRLLLDNTQVVDNIKTVILLSRHLLLPLGRSFNVTTICERTWYRPTEHVRNIKLGY